MSNIFRTQNNRREMTWDEICEQNLMMPGVELGDVVIVQNTATSANSRRNVDPTVSFGEFKKVLPVILTGMDCINDPKNVDSDGVPIMVKAFSEGGAVATMPHIPTEQGIKEGIEVARKIVSKQIKFAQYVGFNSKLEDISAYMDAGVKTFIVDTAHGTQEGFLRKLEEISELCKKFQQETYIIAGNCMDQEGAKSLYDAGADMVKGGIGPGSACSTRVQTGVSEDQFTLAQNLGQLKKPYIVDGGIKSNGHIAVAVACGKKGIPVLGMVGGMFEGTAETPIVKLPDGKKGKGYWGQASEFYMKRHGITGRAPEGIFREVKPRFEIDQKTPLSVKKLLNDLRGNLASTISYVVKLTPEEIEAGIVPNLSHLQEQAIFKFTGSRWPR